MRFVRLYVDGFGRLTNRTFAFAPGLNLIVGPNEAGKSTLHAVLEAMLYGVFDKASVTKAKRQALQDREPWEHGARFGGWLSYVLDSGQSYRVLRSFSTPMETRLESLPDNRDITADFESATHGRLYFADAHLGVSAQVFDHVCVVRQDELAGLEGSASGIADTLMRLSTSASQDHSTVDALALLDDQLREDVGTERAHTKPLASARAEVERLVAIHTVARDRRQEVFTLVAEVDREQDRLDELDEEIARLDYLAALAERQGVSIQIEAMKVAAEEVRRLESEAAELRVWAEFPFQHRESVRLLWEECQRLESKSPQVRARLAQLDRDREDLVGKIESANTALTGMAPVGNINLLMLPLIQRLDVMLASAKESLASAESRLDQATSLDERLRQELGEKGRAIGMMASGQMGDLDRLERRWVSAKQQADLSEQELEQAAKAWARTSLSDQQYREMGRAASLAGATDAGGKATRKGCLPGSRKLESPYPPPEVTVFAQVSPIWERLQSAAIVAAQTAEAASQSESEVRALLGIDSDLVLTSSVIDAARVGVSEYSRLERDANANKQALIASRDEVTRVHQQVQSVERDLRTELAKQGCDSGELRADFDSYMVLCKSRGEYDLAVSARDKLLSDLMTLDADRSTLLQHESDLSTVIHELSELCRQSGAEVSDGGLAPAVAQFEAGCLSHEKWVDAERRLQLAQARLGGGLSSQDRDALQRRIRVLDTEISRMNRSGKERGALRADHDAHEYRDRSRVLAEQRRESQARHSRLMEALKTAQSQTTDLPTLAERLATRRAEVDGLERLGEALKLARVELDAAAREYQRAFAPRLDALVSQTLARATEGRYSSVRTDASTLSVTLDTPERAERISPESLSKGTRDLVYMVLRLGVARYMSESGESLPMLLDDPLVQMDDKRQGQTLEMLAELARESQILLFTKDYAVEDWYQRRRPEDKCSALIHLEL